MHSDRLHAALVAVLLFCLYAASAPRTVALEDDGLFILSSYFMGVAHPPGYPLHSLLGKLFTLLPVGTVAYRVHLLSAAFGALSCALLWLCARTLLESRVAAWLAALALGLSAAFWSQSIIAEVYTLNTFFFFLLLWLALRGGSLALMAFVFGLSLANHWPLMLLGAPALAAALWPRRLELLRRLPLLAALFALGLVPYAWMVLLSRSPLAISFAGPLDSWREIWFFVSRAGYAEVDASASATALDRALFLRYFGAELLLQFAVLGTLLAALGFWAQWRLWPRHVAIALTLAFLMSSVVLIFLLGFDYDAFRKHVFHVYPLPAYGVAALWLGLGFAWLVRQFNWGLRASFVLCIGLLVLVGAVGLQANQLSGYAWVDRYARTLLAALPKDAVVLVKGADVGPLGYVHMVEGVRPDLTLVHPGGLVFGNRLFHPYRTERAAQEAAVRSLVEGSKDPVATTAAPVAGLPWKDQWLFATLEKSASVGIPEALVLYFESDVLAPPEKSAYIAFFQGELRRRYAGLVAQSLQPGEEARRLGPLTTQREFYSAIGVAEGLLSNPAGYRLGTAAGALETAAASMPPDASKPQRARLFELRAYVRLQAGDRPGARADLEAAVAIWPSPANGARAALERLKP